MKNIGKPCPGKPHARFDEGGQAKACSLLYPIRAIADRTDSLVGDDSCLRPPERQTYAAQVASGTDNGHAGVGFRVPSTQISRLTTTETQEILRKCFCISYPFTDYA